MAKEKPTLWGSPVTENDRNHAADEYAWEHFTPAWVPGYDEYIKANEIEGNRMLSRAMKDKLLKDLGVRPKKLPIRVTWVRVAAPDGGRSYNASIDLAAWRRQGYRPATLEILHAAGMQLPPTAYVDSDGTIRREDVALWFVDEERAAANDRSQARYNAEFHALKPAATGNPESPYINVEEHSSHRQLTLSEIKET
jgi:hypothetical protein